MNCLCCGKTLKNDDGTGWHKACVKRFFMTTKLPDIDIDDQKLKVLAEESINKGYTVPGVQKKLSLHLLSEPGNPRLTLVNYPTGYILKPQVDQFKAMPEAEQLVMSMADMIGTGWHKACVKRFFMTTKLPDIDIDDQKLKVLAEESINKGYTVPGVQKKLSLHLLSEPGNPRLTLVNYPTGYILKPQVDQFKAMPEAEQLVMSMADMIGISTVPHALIKGNGQMAYITKRVDRIFEKTTVEMLAMEDFCQLDYRLTQDKYKGSYERCAKIIEKYSSRVGLDMAEFYMRIVFSFVTGNSDMHLKNFSLIETEVGSGDYVLSPAYDLLPINVIMPEDTEQLAIPMNGKKRNVRRKDFLIFADVCGLSRISAEKMISLVVKNKDKMKKMCDESYIPEKMKSDFNHLIEERMLILSD